MKNFINALMPILKYWGKAFLIMSPFILYFLLAPSIHGILIIFAIAMYFVINNPYQNWYI